MKYILPLAFSFCCFRILAQTDNQLKIGLVLSPCFSNNLIINNISESNGVAEIFKNNDVSTLGYSGYALIEYLFNPRVKIGLGIGYSKTGLNSRKSKLIFEQPEPGNPRYYKISRIYHSIIFPLQGKYTIVKKKNDLYTFGSFAPLYTFRRINKNITWYDYGIESTKIADTEVGYRLWNMRCSLGVGYEANINNWLSIFFQPTFDINIMNTFKSALINRKEYSFSLNFGFYLR